MNRTNSLIVPQKRSALPLLLCLLIGSAGLAYGVLRWQQPGSSGPRAADDDQGQAVSAKDDTPIEVEHGQAAPAAHAPSPAGPDEGAASTSGGETPTPVSGGEQKGGEKGAEKGTEQKGSVMVKMEPLIANLDEGDQLRYLKLSVQLEITTDAQPKVQAQLPRARHEALMYMSSLHLSDVQGMLGKQRVHRELQRRIADAIGGGLKRIYFDEFVVQ